LLCWWIAAQIETNLWHVLGSRNRPDGPERRWELPETDYRVNHFVKQVKQFCGSQARNSKLLAGMCGNFVAAAAILRSRSLVD